MSASKVPDLKDQESTRLSSRRRTPVLWPWFTVIAAWTVALLAVLTHQTALINHHYLIGESHLPLFVAWLYSWPAGR